MQQIDKDTYYKVTAINDKYTSVKDLKSILKQSLNAQIAIDKIVEDKKDDKKALTTKYKDILDKIIWKKIASLPSEDEKEKYNKSLKENKNIITELEKIMKQTKESKSTSK